MGTSPIPTSAPDLIVERLDAKQLRVAYPLIRQVQPEVDLRSWVRFTRPLAQSGDAARSGIMAARYAGQRFLCGLLCYRRERDLRRGIVVTAEHLVAVGLLDPDRVLAVLLRELDALGARLGCDAVRVAVPLGPHAAALRRRPERHHHPGPAAAPLIIKVRRLVQKRAANGTGPDGGLVFARLRVQIPRSLGGAASPPL